MLEFLTGRKRVKLEGNDSDFNSAASNLRGILPPANRGEIKQAEKLDLKTSPVESSPLQLSNGTSSQQSKPALKKLTMMPLPPPPDLPCAQSKAKMIDCESPPKHRTSDDKEQNNELGGHRTAVEALLFAAEKMDSRMVSAESMTADPSAEECDLAATPPRPSPSITIIKKNRNGRIRDESKTIEPTDDDVLLGRGGYVNIHPGNIKFRQKALELREWYEASTKEEKYNISNVLIHSVTSQGHRFLEKGPDGQGLWYEVSGNGVRKKASQALRERAKGKKTISSPADN
jgi:hypothetical protein